MKKRIKKLKENRKVQRAFWSIVALTLFLAIPFGSLSVAKVQHKQWKEITLTVFGKSLTISR
ncbi:hypothetical protein CN692_14190 [Bacillus sp. AFS002410]|uniref:hypothetical protein n=1 Tax=Bacillus sp. AFS002410 TaxID=2033481 RepID=UPI000BF1A376|nr:hypothetical protein [Bacillus sp. AFS002410]PEJ57044.1 hypothetical protein CN692_14190 [Bacillus sp. AFS002410]